MNLALCLRPTAAHCRRLASAASILALALVASAQTNPSAQTLPFSLTTQTATTLPAGVAAHKFAAIPTTRIVTPGTADISNSTASNGGGWHANNGSGIGLLASSAQPAGALVVAINTTGSTGIQVAWKCSTIFQQASRDNSVALQYRVGTSGNFTDVGAATTYTSQGKVDGDVSGLFTETLPAAAENQPVVQVRWVYWESNGSAGSRDHISMGNIAITGSSSTPTIPAASATASPAAVPPGQSTLLTVTVTPGTNPASSGLAVTGDLSAIGGSASQTFTAGPNNTFTYTATLPGNLSYGAKTLSFTVTDTQSRSANTTLNLNVAGNLTIFHTNDTHARVTPHKWIVPQHTGNTQPVFEDVGGAAYLGAKMLSLVTGQPDALVLDGGDISEGNPIGDWNGPGFPTGTYGNGTAVEFYKMLDTKLRAIPGRGGRGLDAMVVGNHDIRDITYLNNMKTQTNFPVISINICGKGTHTAYFQPYVILNVNGSKIGVVGYTTESADSPESAVNSAIDVVACDWSSTDSSKIHFADVVNDLRHNQGCSLVILLTHMGHSGLCTPTGANPTPILVDNSVAKLPEIAITGHWHTWAETVWQPVSLNYKTIFTEAGSFEHYIGELRVNAAGQYLSNANYPLQVSAITPDADIAAFIQTRKDQYAATNPTYQVDQLIGYTADALLLDNYMKWWSADEYPWSGNNTAGNWICDAMQWKATALFGHCDLSVESGGGVRSDIPAGPVTYTQIYETFPWPDDTIYLVKMTGQDIWNYFKLHGCDAAMSGAWHVTAYDGIPTAITYNGQPIDLAHQYDVAINNYMYLHDSVPFTDPNPQFAVSGFPNGYLARTALVEFTGTFTQSSPYHAGNARYTLNTDFSGGYRAVVMMMNDADSKTAFDDAFIRMLSANPETLQHRGTPQVPTDLVNADGSVNPANRLSESELYRSYLGFKTGALHPGDIIETWGKGSFFQGDPEFVDQEGIKSDGVEFHIVGHDDSLAKPVFMPSIASFWDDVHKNHYVKFLARKTGTSTVADQTGESITTMDVTAFSAKTLPGNTGDLLLLTGIPTMESFALRFRCDSAVLASSAGITNFPATSTVVSSVNAVVASTTAAPLALTAVAAPNPGTVWNLAPIADAQVSSGNPTTNYGSSSNLFLQSSTTGFGNERAWLKFDLSGLPAGSTITAATLQLYCWKATGAALPVEIDSVTNDGWTETGLTWNNQFASQAQVSTQTLAAAATNVWYNWNVTAFAQGEFAGDKIVSLLAKPITENSGDATPPSYGFDAKEFGSNAPLLQVITQASGVPVTVAHVQYFYRYSSDNVTWGAWTASLTATSAPYAANFTFPQGYGYYEFYSLATDNLGATESAPAAAQAATHYAANPPYTTEAVVSLGGLNQSYDGTPKAVTVTTVPPGLSVNILYNGFATPPTNAAAYSVTATINQNGFTGSASGSLVIAPASQFILFNSLAPATAGSGPITLTASASSGLAVSYASDNTSVATISGNTVTPIAPGTAHITASQAGNPNYQAATPVVESLSVAAGAMSAPSSDVPSLPEWALIALGTVLAWLAVRAMRRSAVRG